VRTKIHVISAFTSEAAAATKLQAAARGKDAREQVKAQMAQMAMKRERAERCAERKAQIAAYQAKAERPVPPTVNAPGPTVKAERPVPPTTPPSPATTTDPVTWLGDRAHDEQKTTKQTQGGETPFLLHHLSPYLVRSPDTALHDARGPTSVWSSVSSASARFGTMRGTPETAWYNMGFNLGSRASAPSLLELIGTSTMPPGPLPAHLQQILSGFENAQARLALQRMALDTPPR
jgi:hypothetical protein